jgi:hypothetical protein
LIRAFDHVTSEGGVVIRSGIGDWPDEYIADNSDALPSRVLNGALFAVLALHRCHKLSGNEAALRAFNRTVPEIAAHLGDYDAGNGLSYYDIRRAGSGKYHAIHVDLLDKLFILTGDHRLHKYAELWRKSVP